MKNFLSAVARSLSEQDIKVRTVVTGSLPEQTIVTVGEEEHVDMTMLTSHGRGGLDLFLTGSIALSVVGASQKPVFIIPHRQLEEDVVAGEFTAAAT